MNNSIQYFLENGIPELEKIKKDFLSNPTYDGYIEKVKGIMMDFGCHIISEVLEENLKRRLNWHVKDHGIKNIMSTVGMLSFTRTRFKNKETKETAYLLDRILGLSPISTNLREKCTKLKVLNSMLLKKTHDKYSFCCKMILSKNLQKRGLS